MLPDPSPVDRYETPDPDQEEAAINQERMADLEIEREEVKGQRYNTTETAPAASFVSSHSLLSCQCVLLYPVNTQPSNLQHDVALSQLFVVHQSVILPEPPA